MSTFVYPTAEFPVVLRPARSSNEEYFAMVDAGLLEGKRVELIDGVIVERSPAEPQHNQFLSRLNQLLMPLRVTGEVWIQGILSIAQGKVFDPDLMLLRKKDGGYKHQLPQPLDVLLIVEAAVSSLNHDPWWVRRRGVCVLPIAPGTVDQCHHGLSAVTNSWTHWAISVNACTKRVSCPSLPITAIT